MPILITGKFCFKGQDIVHKTEKQMQAIRGKRNRNDFPEDPEMTSLDPTMPIGKTSGGIINQT